jgi:tetratricopeptide (TPR) repeat protein
VLDRKLVARATTLEDEGNYVDAVECWREVVEGERNVEALTGLGRSALLAGRVDEAEASLREAIGISPGANEPYLLLGRHYLEAQRFDEATRVLHDSLERIGDRPDTLVTLGETYRRLGESEKARELFQQAIALDDMDGELWYRVGLTHRGDDPAAQSAFQRSLQLDANHTGSLSELGLILWRSGHADEGEASVRRAIEVDHDNVWAHVHLGTIVLTKDPVTAEREFRIALGIWDDVPLFHTDLGDALVLQDRWDEAEAAYKDALALDVNNYLSNLSYGRFLNVRQEFARAIVYLERALRADPGNRRAVRALEEARAHLR